MICEPGASSAKGGVFCRASRHGRGEVDDREKPIMGQWLNLAAADGFRLQAYRADPPSGTRTRGGLWVVQKISGVTVMSGAFATATLRTVTQQSRRRCSTATSEVSLSTTRRKTSPAAASSRHARR